MTVEDAYVAWLDTLPEGDRCRPDEASFRAGWEALEILYREIAFDHGYRQINEHIARAAARLKV